MAEKTKLHKISLSGFKSIGSDDNAVNLELSDANIIIGPNGAGKSNIISFFKMLGSMMAESFQVYVGRNGFAEGLLHFGSKYTPLIHASLEFQTAGTSGIYEMELARAAQDTLVFLSESVTDDGRHFELASGHKESYLMSSPSVSTGEENIRKTLSNCRTFQFHDSSSTAHIRGTSKIDNNRCLTSDGGNIPAYLYMLKNTTEEYRRYYNRIVERIRFVVPQFSDFILEPQVLNKEYIRLQWKSTDAFEYPFGPEQLSDGSIRFIALATLLLQPPELLPRIIVIDEPELGLHPQAVDILASLIKTAARHVQVIVATQSARLINSFAPSQIIVAEYEKSKGCSLFRHLDEDKLKIWLDDYSLSELWEKNVLGGQP